MATIKNRLTTLEKCAATVHRQQRGVCIVACEHDCNSEALCGHELAILADWRKEHGKEPGEIIR